MNKTVRFGALVSNSGRPQFVTLWTAPEKDPRVSSALKENRVLTVIEEPGKKPHGQPGLHPGPHSLFLLFPRPLVLGPAARVIGINYTLADQPEVKDPVLVPQVQPKTKSPRTVKPKPLPEIKSEPAPPPKPAKRTYTVRLKRTATLEETRHLEAEDRADAERQVLEQARAETFNLSMAVVTEEILK